jgi:hypothetical protein
MLWHKLPEQSRYPCFCANSLNFYRITWFSANSLNSSGTKYLLQCKLSAQARITCFNETSQNSLVLLYRPNYFNSLAQHQLHFSRCKIVQQLRYTFFSTADKPRHTHFGLRTSWIVQVDIFKKKLPYESRYACFTTRLSKHQSDTYCSTSLPDQVSLLQHRIFW